MLLSLYLPIGRMIMYDSLIKEIVKLTPKNHVDFEDLLNAQKLILSATRQADRVVEKRKNMESVLRIQSLVIGSDIAEPHRRYVYEGEVSLLFANNKPPKERLLILFNDVLLLAKPKKKKYEIDFMHLLAEITIVDLEESRSSFKVIHNEVEWVIDSEDKQTWIQMLNTTIKKLGSIPQEIYALRYEDEQEQNESLDDIDFKLTKQQLIEKIMQWSEMKDADDVLLEVKLMAEKIKKVRQTE